MKQFEYTIAAENGLHARPSGLMVKEAQKFGSALTICCADKEASLKKLFAVMGLGVKQGHTIIVTATGDDEVQAAETIEAFIKSHF